MLAVKSIFPIFFQKSNLFLTKHYQSEFKIDF